MRMKTQETQDRASSAFGGESHGAMPLMARRLVDASPRSVTWFWLFGKTANDACGDQGGGRPLMALSHEASGDDGVDGYQKWRC